jgi:hypothetical protein
MAVAMLFFFSISAFSQTFPVAINDTITLKKHHTTLVNVLQNDYDPDNHEIMLFYINNSGNGYGYSFLDSSIRYTNTKTHGLDSIKYSITRKNDWESYATAWLFADVIENELPDFSHDIPTIMAGEEVEFNLYDIASDQDGDYFYVNRIWDPEHGEELDNTDSTFSFIITENYNGLDSCRVKLTEIDPEFFFTTYFVFNVAYNPELPFAVNDTSFAYQGDTAYIPVLLNDGDPQNDALKIYDADFETYTPFLDFNDSLIIILPRATADTGLHNYYSYFNSEATNNNHISNRAQGFLHVLENPNLPQGVVDSVTVMAGFPVDIPVLMNDEDINGDSLQIVWAQQYKSTGVTTYTDTTVTFTPNSNLPGWHYISYKFEEKHNPAHYNKGEIVVEAIENPNLPVAINDTITIQGAQIIEFNPLLNDLDPESMPIKLNNINFNHPLIHCNSIGDSLVRIKTVNTDYTIGIKYTYCRIDNEAMISSEALIIVKVLLDESSFYCVTDTIKSTAGLCGVIDLVENDYNPGNETLRLKYVYDADGLKFSRLSDSTVKYIIDFSVDSPVQTYYELWNVNDSIDGVGWIYLDIQNPTSLIDTLDINNIRAPFGATGMHFYDPVNKTGLFEVPAGSGKNTIYQNSLWIGGKSDYALHVAAETWHLHGNDFWPGPVSENYDNDDLANYRMCKISREEINFHIAHYNDQDYEPIESIATWPGNGTPELGQVDQLAPYFDQNADGIFNPYDGDVPMIRGDQSLYFIFNDDYDLHTESGGVPMKIEIHGNAYAFDQPEDSALFNTIFLHYDIYNRSENTYEDTYIGMHNFFDLGYALDNYVQCDVSRGNAFVYNATKIDGNGEPYAYGANPPVQGVTILGGPALPTDNLDNPTGGCDESINGLNFDDGVVDNERLGMTKFAYRYYTYGHSNIYPETDEDYYNWLTGHWNGNFRWLYGSNTGPSCNFILPGDSDPLNWGTNCEYPNGGYNQNGYFWTEETAGHQPGSRYGVSITGPFTFAPGDVQSLDIAFVYARDNDTTDQLSAIDIMNQRIDTIRNRVENGEIIYLPSYSVGINEITIEKSEIPIFPNPTNGNLINVDLREITSSKKIPYQIVDLLGKQLRNGEMESGKINSSEIGGIRPGVYFFIIQQQGLPVTQKLIIR